MATKWYCRCQNALKKLPWGTYYARACRSTNLLARSMAARLCGASYLRSEQLNPFFRACFFLSCCSPATSKTGPPGAPCESANVTEKHSRLAPLRAPRRAPARSKVSIWFQLISTNMQNFSASSCVVSVAKRWIDRGHGRLSISGIVYI